MLKFWPEFLLNFSPSFLLDFLPDCFAQFFAQFPTGWLAIVEQIQVDAADGSGLTMSGSGSNGTGTTARCPSSPWIAGLLPPLSQREALRLFSAHPPWTTLRLALYLLYVRLASSYPLDDRVLLALRAACEVHDLAFSSILTYFTNGGSRV